MEPLNVLPWGRQNEDNASILLLRSRLNRGGGKASHGAVRKQQACGNTWCLLPCVIALADHLVCNHTFLLHWGNAPFMTFVCLLLLFYYFILMGVTWHSLCQACAKLGWWGCMCSWSVNVWHLLQFIYGHLKSKEFSWCNRYSECSNVHSIRKYCHCGFRWTCRTKVVADGYLVPVLIQIGRTLKILGRKTPQVQSPCHIEVEHQQFTLVFYMFSPTSVIKLLVG
jgi:hypothetical protein